MLAVGSLTLSIGDLDLSILMCCHYPHFMDENTAAQGG